MYVFMILLHLKLAYMDFFYKQINLQKFKSKNNIKRAILHKLKTHMKKYKYIF